MKALISLPFHGPVRGKAGYMNGGCKKVNMFYRFVMIYSLVCSFWVQWSQGLKAHSYN